MDIYRYRKYLGIDLKRAFYSWRFPVGILGVCGVMIFSSLENSQWHISVLNAFSLITYSMPFLLTFVFAAVGYSGAFCDDIECRYITVQILRGDVRSYTAAKMTTVFINGMCIMTLGMLLYAIILKFRFPWSSEIEGTFEMLLEQGGFRGILEREWFPAYIVLFSMQFGLAAGMLSAAAAYVSLFYSNKLFVLSSPLVIWYFAQHAGEWLGGKVLNPYVIFCGSNRVFDRDILCVLYAAMVSIGVSLLLIRASRKKLERLVMGTDV